MSLLRNTITQSGLTLTSRALGFVRDILVASRIGAGPVGDAFVTALMFPNLFRRVFAEGAFAQAFVPAYARTLEAEGPEAARVIAQQTLRGLLLLTAVLVIVAQLAMPLIMRVMHAGYAPGSESFQLAVLLTQITMPYLVCMAISALFSGVLNAAGRFALSAGVPILLNIFLIIAVSFGETAAQTSVYAAVAVSASGLVQALILWAGVSRQAIQLSLGWPQWTPALKRIVVLAVPGTIAASGTQINILVSQALASFEVGAKSWLFFADRLYQLPLGIVGIAVGVAILPRLARLERSGKSGSGHGLLDEGIGLAMALTLPAAIALMIAPSFLISGLYERGQFTAYDAKMAGMALVHFGWGVPAFVLIKVLAPAFFAREDTVTPMRYSIASVIINTLLGAALFFWLQSTGRPGFPGLAIATSLAGWMNAAALLYGLIARGWYRPGLLLVKRLTATLFASLAMGGVLGLMMASPDWVEPWLAAGGFMHVLIFVAIGLLTYLLLAVASGAIRVSDLRRQARS